MFCISASLLHCRRRKAPGRKPACPGGEVPHQTCPAVWACIWGEGFREWQVLNRYKWGEIESKVWIDGGHISHPMTRSHLCSRDQSWLVHDLLDFPKDFPSHGSISPQIDPDERPLSLSPSKVRCSSNKPQIFSKISPFPAQWQIWDLDIVGTGGRWQVQPSQLLQCLLCTVWG